MRPALKAGLRPLWRDSDTVQIGVDPRRAIALSGMSGAAVVLGLLDGSRDRAQVLRAAAEHGVPAPVTERVLGLLAAAGALDDFPAGLLRMLPRSRRAGLARELAAVSLVNRDGDGGARALARRLSALVAVCGTGQVADGIADILRASGIGQVTRAVPWTARDRQARGTRREAGLPEGAVPDLAILVGRPAPELAARLVRERVAHLAVSASEAIGTVGPLVLPGRTACLHCLDLARTDTDPAWPVLVAQLISGGQAEPAGCSAAMAAAVAAQASAQAIEFVDSGGLAEAKAAILPSRSWPAANGTLELVLPAWEWRRRTWLPHPGCGCGGHRPAGHQGPAPPLLAGPGTRHPSPPVTVASTGRLAGMLRSAGEWVS